MAPRDAALPPQRLSRYNCSSVRLRVLFLWLLLALGVPAALAWADDWPAYLGGVDHRSYSAESVITPPR